MKDCIRIDYETRSLVDLKKVGVWRYAQDPSTRVLCFGYKLPGFSSVKPWRIGQPIPQELIDAINRGVPVKAFNANFERAITECCMAKLGMPIPKASQWVDTQAVALMCSLPPSLEQLATVLGLEQEKDKEGKRLINKFCKPNRKGEFTEPEDDPADFTNLVRYCMQDVRTEEAADLAMPIHSLGVEEQRVWTMDSNINRRGIPMDMSLLRGAIKIEQRAQIEARHQLTELTKRCKIKVTTPGQTARIVALSKELGYESLHDTKKETITVCLKDKDLPPLLKKVLRIRQRTAQAAVKKYHAAMYAVCRDGRVRSIHRYHGAHTGRWTAKLLQTQNLARPSRKLDDFDNDLIRRGDYEAIEALYGEPMGVLRDAVRHIVRAIQAEKLIVCDLASIEARVLGWLAQDPKYLKAFREGLDLYKVTAAEIFGIGYDDVDDDQRWVGKQAVLALGYSMGVDTFYRQCVKSKPDIKRSLLERAVKAYRKTYRRIVKYWSLIETAAISAVASAGTVTRAGVVAFEMVKGYLTMILPSGRRLWYPEAKLVQQKTSWGELKTVVAYKTLIKNRLWVTKTTYGGRLTENAVQAIARDVLVFGMHKMEAQKLPIVFHVHDEVITSVPKVRKVEEVVSCLTSCAPWAPGLPLGAKGFETQYYRKD